MNTKEEFTRKAINFDLDTKALQVIFKSKNPFVYMAGYRQIGKFLKKNGFTHRQWSGYVSKEPMTTLSVTKITRQLNRSLPWLRRCVKKFDVTNIGDTFDLMHIFNNSKSQPVLRQSMQNMDKSGQKASKSVFSVVNVKQNAKIISDKAKSVPKRQQNKNKNNEL